MLGFSPLASAALADDGLSSATLSAVGVTAQTPVVSSSSVSQAHTLSATGVSTSSPVVSDTSFAQAFALTPSSISTGTPVVDNATSAQSFSLVPSSISTATPVVDNTTASQTSVFNTSDLSTPAPTVGSTGITQVHSVSLNDTTSGTPVTDSPDLDESQSLTPLGIATGSPTLDSPVLSAFDLQLSPTGVTTGTPDLGDERLGGYNNARNNFFDGAVSNRSGYFETNSSYYYSNFWSAVPSSSITNTSTYIQFTGYIKQQYSNQSLWKSATFTLYKSGSVPVTISIGSTAYSSGNPPSAGSSGHVGLDDIVSGDNELSWLDDSFSHSTADSTAFPVEVVSNRTDGTLKLQNLSGTTVYDTYNRPNWSTGGQTGFMFGGGFTVNRWRVDILAIYYGNYYTDASRVYSTRFSPPQPFTTNDTALTHLLTGVGLLGFDTGTPVVGDAGLILNTEITLSGVDSETPSVGSAPLEQSHTFSTSAVDCQQPVVSAASLSQDHSVQAEDLSTQTPIVDDCDLSQTESLSATSVSSGSPVVGIPTFAQHNANLPVGVISGVPNVGSPLYQRNEPVDDIVSGTPTVGSADLTETTLSISANSVSSSAPDLNNVTFFQGHSLSASNVASLLADVGQTSFVFKGKVGALNSVTVNLSKNSTAVNLSKNSTTVNLSKNSVG
jgi:hypothetical protein